MKLFTLALLFLPSLLFGYDIGDKVEPEKAIINLSDGHKLVFGVKDNRLQVFVVDTEYTVVEPQMASILVNIDNPGKRNDKWRGLLEADKSGAALSSPLILPLPHNFSMRVIVRYHKNPPETFHNVRFSK